MPAAPEIAEANSTRETGKRPSRLWLWIVAAFVIQALAWTSWFIIAAHNKVEEVPLETPVSR